MAPFVFLPRSAPARIIPADLSRCPTRQARGRADWRRGAGRPWRAVRPRAVRLTGTAFDHLAHGGRWRRRVALDLHPEDAGDDGGLDAVSQLVEHLERFVLV